MEANIRRWLEAAEADTGEAIEAVVVGKHDDPCFDERAQDDENVILSREVGLAKLDQDYDNYFGPPCCYPMYAWTASRIYFIHEYEGLTKLAWVPRHPVAIEPAFIGE